MVSGAARKAHRRNQDLWADIRGALDGRAVNLVHVKSRRPDLVASGVATAEAFVANATVDKLADDAAAGHQAPEMRSSARWTLVRPWSAAA